MSIPISSHAGGTPTRGEVRAHHAPMHLVRSGEQAAPSPAPRRETVICSFHTGDDYYATHARELRLQLDALGLPHALVEVDRVEGEDWADVTRRKIGFIRDACRAHPDSMVFWIDVDCRITHLPDYVRDSTARGAGVDVVTPQVIGLDLRRWDLVGPVRDIRVSESVKDDV